MVKALSNIKGVFLMLMLLIILVAVISIVSFTTGLAPGGSSSESSFRFDSSTGTIIPIKTADSVEYEVRVNGNVVRTFKGSKTVKMDDLEKGDSVSIVNSKNKKTVQTFQVDNTIVSEEVSIRDYKTSNNKNIVGLKPDENSSATYSFNNQKMKVSISSLAEQGNYYMDVNNVYEKKENIIINTSIVSSGRFGTTVIKPVGRNVTIMGDNLENADMLVVNISGGLNDRERLTYEIDK